MFVAWASDVKAVHEWFCMRTCSLRFSLREGPSHALLLSAITTIAETCWEVREAAQEFVSPLIDSRGRVSAPPFTTDHLDRILFVCRLPGDSVTMDDLDACDPTGGDGTRAFSGCRRLQVIFRWYYLWQGYL